MQLRKLVPVAIACLSFRTTKAFPTPEDLFQDGLEASGTSAQNQSVETVGVPWGTQPFEYYLDGAIRYTAAYIAPELRSSLYYPVTVISTWDGNRPSKSAKDFVAINMCYQYITRTECFGNTRARGLAGLTEWSRTPRLAATRFDQAIIKMEDLTHILTLEEAFVKLKQAGWDNPWIAIMISKFKAAPPGHQDEVFMAFFAASIAQGPRWVYVGTRSGDIIADESPNSIAGSAVEMLAAGNSTIATQ